MAVTSVSLKDYLKKYQSGADDQAKKKKKKKRKKEKTNPNSIGGGGVLVVDEDPVWQKPVQLEGPEDEDSADEVPQVEEDVEVKRMRRMEAISRKPYHAISEDGSGWVSVSERPADSDLSPPRQRRQRFDTPSPERNRGLEEVDLSLPRQRRRRVDTPSPEARPSDDLSPPRRNRGQSGVADLSPPRRSRRRSEEDSGRGESALDGDLSPLRRRKETELSPLRRRKEASPTKDSGLSPPRRRKEPARVKEVRRMGLMSGEEIKKENEKKRKEEKSRFASMDAARSGKGAEPVFRDKEGKPITREEIMKKQEEEKPKEKKLEWGKGLAQKREAEVKADELELEKERPFARTRDDPELDKMLKERLRWGDPMAHLVKKNSDFVLEDLGNDEKMKESGFLIPQTVPSHSWIKRGIDFPPNRYGIRPGRHWDGVDRCNGHEKELFKRQNEKRATETEAYLWSVSDM